MANRFDDDSSCKALWRFESAEALLVDSKSTNTLTAVAGATVNTSDYKEGVGAADLTRASNQYFNITDANLASGFPFKSSESNRVATFCCWAKWDSLGVVNQGIMGKLQVANSCGAYMYNSKIYLDWNASWQDTGITLSTGIWYHIACRMDGPNGDSDVRIYRASDGQIFTYAKTNWAVLGSCTADFRVGTFNTATNNCFDGIIDEAVVFNRLLTDGEIDLIRLGEFGWPTTINASLINATASLPFQNYVGPHTPSILFMCGWELGEPWSGWDSYSLSSTDICSSALFRSGRFCLLMTNSTSYLRKSIHWQSELYIQVALFWSGATPASGKYLRWMKGATVLGTLNVDANAKLCVYTGDGASLKATGNTVLLRDMWYVVELHLTISDSGVFEVRLDGVSEISWSGDTQPGSDTDIDTVELNCPTNNDVYYDDFFIITPSGYTDLTWADRARIAYLPPTGDDTTNWSSSYALPSTKHFWGMQDLMAMDRRSYLYTTTADVVEKFNLANCPVGANQKILAVQASAHFVSPSSTPGASAQLFLISGATTHTADAKYVTPGITPGVSEDSSTVHLYTWEVNPASSSDWTAAEIDGLVLGFKKVG